MSRQIVGPKEQASYNLIDITVERNAYGRQIHSFNAEIPFEPLKGTTKSIPALFIRAPRIVSYGKEVKILASYEGAPVLVRQGIHLAASFHPELSSDLSVHRYFLDLVTRTNEGLRR